MRIAGAAVLIGDRGWRWTFASGCVTFLLAGVAFFLPDIEWAPTGGIVGWLLLLAGLFELTFGFKRGPDAVGDAAVGSGLVTAAAGLLFVFNPMASYFPLANVIVGWLFVRGAWVLAMAARASSRRFWPWLVLSGLTDVLLALALLSDLRVTVLVYVLFGPTREIVARFSFVLATSFLITAISQFGIAVAKKREGLRKDVR